MYTYICIHIYVIIENGVLVRWPNEAIPENGHVTIPNSVTCIGDEAFTFCHSLTSITIPNSVTSIREKAFSGCICLRSIIIPNSVTSIGEGAFVDCNSLTSIVCKALVPPIFSGDHSGNDQHRIDLGYYKKLIVPIGTKHLYEQAEGWKKCSPIVEEDL